MPNSSVHKNQDEESSISTTFDNHVIELPINCSESVFNCICKTLKEDYVDIPPEPNEHPSEKTVIALRPFFDGIQCPLSIMDLSGLFLSDFILAKLLISQHRTLTTLNLAHTTGITSAGVCSILCEMKIEMLKLCSLKLTSAELLRIPKFRRGCGYRIRYGRNRYEDIDLHLSSLPVVSEDDVNREALSGNGAGGRPLFANRRSNSPNAMSESQEVYNDTIPHFMEYCPSIEHLYLIQGLLFNIEDEQQDVFLSRILRKAKNKIRTLDLSEWQNIHLFLNGLTALRNLTTLILYDVQFLENSIGIIKEIKTLVTLDLSQSERSTGRYARPVSALHSLVVNLKRLKYLDISGTNLISASSDDDRPFRGTGIITSDIVGLSFLNEPLNYLGIFNCDNASHFQYIPAEKVCGDHNEDQIMLALEVYMERPKMMQAVLNESYQLYRFGNNLKKHVEALHLVLRALSLHQLHSSLQIAGSASMFYIIRNVRMNRDTKRSVISALVNGMENHMEEQVMVRNCCLSLCQFEIPHEIMFNYGKVAFLLVRVLQTHNSDQLTQRIVVFLLNSMACHVEGNQKIEVGNMGAIEVILDQIRKKLNAGVCDDVMEVGWSFLWNITDETPSNCDRFLKSDGLYLFKKCYTCFRNETELVRNMMGLIGNIAEVEHLRCELMNADYIDIFVRLLSHLVDGIEISYNSAGVLAHLVSDGNEAWSQRVGKQLPRDNVMNAIIKATETWDLTARRYINYRSFKPILKLLPMFDSIGSQYWAAWALANLTSTDMDKYCPYVQDEGGETLLEEVLFDSRTPNGVKKLAKLVLKNIHKWRKSVALHNCAPIVLTDNSDMEIID